MSCRNFYHYCDYFSICTRKLANSVCIRTNTDRILSFVFFASYATDAKRPWNIPAAHIKEMAIRPDLP